MSITDFLNARIAEDEAVARAATSGPWRYDPTKVNSIDHSESVFAGPTGSSATTVASTGPEDDPQSMSDAAHIARHDPARVLAECAAKRAIVELHQALGESGYPDAGLAWEATKTALKTLAAIYADHPDYQDAWKVGP